MPKAQRKRLTANKAQRRASRRVGRYCRYLKKHLEGKAVTVTERWRSYAYSGDYFEREETTTTKDTDASIVKVTQGKRCVYIHLTAGAIRGKPGSVKLSITNLPTDDEEEEDEQAFLSNLQACLERKSDYYHATWTVELGHLLPFN